MKTFHYDAAGGIVVASHGEGNDRVLVLRRPSHDEIRLPKGRIEKGESRQEAALREVSEESGYDDLEIVETLGHQVVEFDYKDEHIIRNEYYFLMRLTSPRQIERDPHEYQFLPAWLGWEEALEQLTFEPEREWLCRAREQA